MNKLFASIMDSIVKATPGPANATDYFKINFLELLASLLLMAIAASFTMAAVKYVTIKLSKSGITKKVLPNSTSNEKIIMLDSRLPEGWWFVIQTFVLIGIVLLVRRAFGASFDFNFYSGPEGALTLIESLIAFGFLAIFVPRWGMKFAESLSYGIARSQLEKQPGVNGIVTPTEYVALGTPGAEPPKP